MTNNWEQKTAEIDGGLVFNTAAGLHKCVAGLILAEAVLLVLSYVCFYASKK